MNTAAIGKLFLVLGLAARQIVRRAAGGRLARADGVLGPAPISVVARADVVAARATHRLRWRPIAVRRRAPVTPAELGAAIDSVLGIDLFVFRRSCWKRAMVLQRFLSLNGIETRLNFGVQQTTDGTVNGHAWLEHQGQRLLERDAGTYVVTFTLPLEGATGRERSAG